MIPYDPKSRPGVPFTMNPIVSHWACLEIDRSQHPLISLCGEEMEKAPTEEPEHMCSVCQILAPHHSENCLSCKVLVWLWKL